jgi:hypothetical protein
MNMQRLALVLTILNVFILAYLVLLQPRSSAPAPAPDRAAIASVIRARALEIVDDKDRVRAMIRVFPPDPAVKMPDGTTGYPETVLLRLIDSKGAPNVKIAATEDGSAVSLGGESNPTHVQVLARGGNTSLKLVNQDGHEQVLKP